MQLASSATHVDLLVNNAGFSAPGRYDTRSWAEHERQLRVMGVATLELTHRLLPDMLERAWGRIINVASITGLFAGTPRDVGSRRNKSAPDQLQPWPRRGALCQRDSVHGQPPRRDRH